jgi:hypothetical protein
MTSLGNGLFSELAPKFFAVLSGPNARVYLDVVDGMERVEVLEIIDRVLRRLLRVGMDRGGEAL